MLIKKFDSLREIDRKACRQILISYNDHKVTLWTTKFHFVYYPELSTFFYSALVEKF
jgi:hypothetical protein